MTTNILRGRVRPEKSKKIPQTRGLSAVNSNELAERLGKSAFNSAEIIGENILRSMLAN